MNIFRGSWKTCFIWPEKVVKGGSGVFQAQGSRSSGSTQKNEMIWTSSEPPLRFCYSFTQVFGKQTKKPNESFVVWLQQDCTAENRGVFLCCVQRTLVRTSRASCYSKSQALETGKSCRRVADQFPQDKQNQILHQLICNVIPALKWLYSNCDKGLGPFLKPTYHHSNRLLIILSNWKSCEKNIWASR